MKCYTQEDVEELIKTAKDIERVIGQGWPPNPESAWHQELQDALKPFLPDPEDELVEAMARTDYDTWNAEHFMDWDGADEDIKETNRECMRRVLTLLKNRGLLKELT